MTPPRLARAALERFVTDRLRDAVAGDLEELFRDEARTSLWRARLRYWRRTVEAIWLLGGRARASQPASHRGDPMIRTLLHDLLHGSRLFVRQPGYAWAAVLTLMLAIGANTVIFSIVNVVAFRPLPIAHAERLGWILATAPGAGLDRAGVALPDVADYQREVTAFAHLAAWRRQPVTLREGDSSTRALSQRVIGDLHALWGLRSTLGRTLTAADEGPAAEPVAVLSHQFWTARFGGARQVLGRPLRIDGREHTIVGVLDPAIELGNLAEVDVWLPETADASLASRGERGWRPVGLLASDRTLADAQAMVGTVASRLSSAHPDTHRDVTVRVGSTMDALGGADVWTMFGLLSLVVGLLLLMACANITNLLIARLIARRQELAVRSALGATRARIVRQIVGESLALGIAGGLAGLAVAWAGLAVMRAAASEPFFKQIGFDERVVAFAIGLSAIAPLIFAVVPTWRLLGQDLKTPLTDATARSIGGRAVSRGRAALVVVQVSLAVALLIVSALVVQSMRAVIRADLGYDPSPLIAAVVDVPEWKVADPAEAQQLRRRLLDRAREIPGVTGAALVTELPSMHFASPITFDITARPAETERDRPSAGLTVTSPDYFRVVGVPIVAGRAFEEADRASPDAVTVISASAAARYWGGPSEALGTTIRVPAGEGRVMEARVVGVARDVTNPDLDPVPSPTLFLLDDHRPTRTMHLVLRSAAPAQLAPAIREAAREVDADLPLFRLETVTATFAEEHSSARLLGALFAAFAFVAVLLATAGLYGVVSYAVSQRTPEIALRLALGAPRRAIAQEVVGRSLKLTIVGTIIGLVGAAVLSRSIASVLFGIDAMDPATYAGASALALGAALAASWVPMHRAARIDPLESLRQA